MSSQPQALPSQFRGIYHRVAKRLGVDPSYVSRVARHERQSDVVSAELKKEVDQILMASRTILIESVAAQLGLALTFCKQARKARAAGDPDDGCMMCARQASETAFKFIAKLKLQPGEYEELGNRAERLRAELQKLNQEAGPSGSDGAAASSQ